MECKHKNKLPVYGRDEKNWISSVKIRGEMVFICQDCRKIVKETVESIKEKCPLCGKGELGAESKGLGENWITYSCGHEIKFNNKQDALCEENVGGSK